MQNDIPNVHPSFKKLLTLSDKEWTQFAWADFQSVEKTSHRSMTPSQNRCLRVEMEKAHKCFVSAYIKESDL